MEDKILFIILNNEIKMMTSKTVDHWKWYQSLGGDPSAYDNVIRGFVTDKEITFFKTNYRYDQEVIDASIKYGPKIRKHLNKDNAVICCGITRNSDGTTSPAHVITKQEMDDYEVRKEQERLELEEKKRQEEQQKLLQRNTEEDLIEFKNDYSDDNFAKFATKFTTIILASSIISKIFLVSTKKLLMDNRWNSLLVFVQIICLIFSIILYKKKNSTAKYTSLVASITMFITFNLSEIIIGTINLFFTIDEKYIKDSLNYIEKKSNKAKVNLNKTTKKIKKKK